MGKRTVIKALSLIIALIMSCGFFAASVNSPASADKMDDLEAERERLQRELKRVEASIKETEGEIDKLDEYLAYYDEKMKLQEDELKTIDEQIAQYEMQIEALAQSVAEKEKEVEEGIALFRARLRELYIYGNDSLASVLAGSADFYDLLTRMEIFERISKHDSDMIDRLNEMVDELEAEKASWEESKVAAEMKWAEKNLNLEKLTETYNNHAETKEMRERERADYEARGDRLEAEEKRIEQEMQAEIKRQQEEAERRRLEEEARRKAEEEARRQAAIAAGEDYVPQDTRSFASYSDTGFIWPVPSVRNMTDGYGNRWIIEEQRSNMHKGIDITKPGCKGEPVVASAAGEVIIAVTGWGGGYGNHVVIDHGNKISTLYGHLDSLSVKTGDIVEQGQQVGTIGNSGNSYGAHLHFEVRVNGQHVDPLGYVNINN